MPQATTAVPVNLPDRIIQLYLSSELREEILVNMKARGETIGSQYVRKLIKEDTERRIANSEF